MLMCEPLVSFLIGSSLDIMCDRYKDSLYCAKKKKKHQTKGDENKSLYFCHPAAGCPTPGMCCHVKKTFIKGLGPTLWTLE